MRRGLHGAVCFLRPGFVRQTEIDIFENLSCWGLSIVDGQFPIAICDQKT